MAKSAVVFEWKVPPETLAAGVRRYGQKLEMATFQVGTYLERKMEAYAREKAPWTDRTGNARSGLVAVTVREGNAVVVYLIHSVHYGIFLELARAGKFAIIKPTIEVHIPEAQRLLQQIIGK